jgi:hypothetical protein
MLRIEGSELARTLMQLSLIGRYDAERAWKPLRRLFPGILLPESDLRSVLATAREWIDIEHTLWTDGSCLDSGKVVCSIVWKDPNMRGGRGGKAYHVGRNREVFDAEFMRFTRRSPFSPQRSHEADITQSSQTLTRLSNAAPPITSTRGRIWPSRLSAKPIASWKMAMRSIFNGSRATSTSRDMKKLIIWQNLGLLTLRWDPQNPT